MSKILCECCGRKLNPATLVPLELDQRISEYHDFGNVPDNQSQGWFDFGPDCANKARGRAARKLLAANLLTLDKVNLASNAASGKGAKS